jgi:hypothetical protein
MFFKAKAPKESETDNGVRIASTTDSMEAVDDASAWYIRRGEPEPVVYTEIRRSTPEADAGTEHSEPLVMVDGVRVETKPVGPNVPPPPGEHPGYMS